MDRRFIVKLLRMGYTGAHYLAIPGILLRLLWRSRRTKDYRQRWHERFSYISPLQTQSGSIWVHAVSVGEVIAAIPLIKALKKDYPRYAIVVTTTTPTGSEQVIKHLAGQVIHVYAPYDVSSVVYRFLKRLRVRFCIIMETELWPNMLSCCQHRNIPVLLANARLSERSYRRYRYIRWLTQSMLLAYSMVAAQGLLDGERFLALGLSPKQLMISGNIKFDIDISEQTRQQGQRLRSNWQSERPVLIAASTHEGEEQIILAAFQLILKTLPNALLILVPRHPDRFTRVARLCESMNFRYVLRSQRQLPDSTTSVLLGDTMGELRMFYAACDIAFVGGSLVNCGGHNLIEPAAFGLPILSGPYLHNFKEISGLLQKAGAAQIVHDATSLANAVIALFSAEQLCHKMGTRACEVIAANRGALHKHLNWIKQHFI